MVSIYAVDPNALIERVAEELKKTDLVQPPEWAQFVKTGVAKQRPPVSSDWWYIRAAALLRAVYTIGPIGVNKLRTKYGSKQQRGVRPEKFRIASGNIIRTALQQLEKEGLIAQNKDEKKKGRIIAPKGQSMIEKCADAVAKAKAPAPKEEKKAKPKADVATDAKEEAKVEQ
ncbi:MAG: 30S ribosomal protein S19e [Nanoarchaeota archaeon]